LPAAISMTAPPPGIGRARAQQLARRELARPMYKPSRLARIWHDIEHWFSSLGGFTVQGSSSWVGPILVILVVVAILALLLYLAGPPRRTRLAQSGPVLPGRPLTAGEHRAAADKLAASGDYGPAIIERVRAIAAHLEARQLLPPRPGRTADELAAEASRVIPAEAGPLAAAARLFDDVRYGGRAGSEPGYARIRELDLRILAGPGMTGSPAGPQTPAATLPATRQGENW
jgi:hypothetical protein